MDRDTIYIIIGVVAVILVSFLIYHFWPVSTTPTFVGCYIDTVELANRAIPKYGGYPVTMEECEKTAKDGGYTLFGFQYGGSQGNPITLGQCWVGNDMKRAQQYGVAPNNSCKQIPSTNDYVGGPLVNAVYTI